MWIDCGWKKLIEKTNEFVSSLCLLLEQKI